MFIDSPQLSVVGSSWLAGWLAVSPSSAPLSRLRFDMRKIHGNSFTFVVATALLNSSSCRSQASPFLLIRKGHNPVFFSAWRSDNLHFPLICTGIESWYPYAFTLSKLWIRISILGNEHYGHLGGNTSAICLSAIAVMTNRKSLRYFNQKSNYCTLRYPEFNQSFEELPISGVRRVCGESLFPLATQTPNCES